MDAAGVQSALTVGTRVLAFSALLLYLMRTRKQRMIRGYPLIVAVALTFALCATGWALAAVAAFTRDPVRSALAATVPLLQVLLLAASIRWFITRVGRDPSPLPASQFARAATSDTLMHAFVLFVLTIGAFIVIVALEPTSTR
jgi:hypothetical protein